MDAIRRTKAVLSPWGWGEACLRDYETFHLGAVLIKPSSDHVESHCDVYRAGETYVACRPDFADLPEIMDDVVRRWDDYLEMRQRCKRLAVRAWQPRTVARLVAKVVGQCWQRRGERWPSELLEHVENDENS